MHASSGDTLVDNPASGRPEASPPRRLPIGAEIVPGMGTHFRVWAPAAQAVSVELPGERGADAPRRVPLTAEGDGYFSGLVRGVGAGTRYRLHNGRGAFPDPASRFQPEGPHGPSEIVDAQFAWTDAAWRGLEARDLVIYELHVGTFTLEGTWRAAREKLPELAQLGITMLEIMPVADFSGRFGWGYDGVNFFAPTRLYGAPDDVRAFVDRAHALGVAVILDVVYNHFGPDGNYLREFSPHYFSRRYGNEWGESLNFDDEHAGPVREFFTANARYWIEEFHFDGLRLDATQQIFDASPEHVLAEVARAARAAAGGRTIFLVAENETQCCDLVRSTGPGACGLDALWNDDFHHSAMVAATGRAEAYYSDFRGTAQEFVSAAKHGFLFQGQWYHWQRRRRGSPGFDLGPANFVTFLQNHDQVSNSLRGARLHEVTTPGLFRALTALLLLGRQIPLLFQGQEFAASSPFLYFADHEAGLGALVREGRRKFLEQFATISSGGAARVIADPGAEETFTRSRLDWSERPRDRHAATLRLHADLLRLRREEAVLCEPAAFDGAVLGERAFVLRHFSADDRDDRLLLVNLGVDAWVRPAPEPLLAPCAGLGWRVQWSSEAPEYGGGGTPPLETTASWILPGHAAVLLAPDENCDPPAARLTEKD